MKEYSEYIRNLIETDFLEGCCSEETANDYKQAIKYIVRQNEELKAITKTYNAYNTEKEDDKIILADRSYFDNGIFNDNLISKRKIAEKLKKDIKSINEKLHGKEYINLYRTYRLKGMKTKCQEILKLLKSEVE